MSKNKKIIISIIVIVLIIVALLIMLYHNNRSFEEFLNKSEYNEDLYEAIRDTVDNDNLLSEEEVTKVLEEYDSYTIVGDSFLEDLGIRVVVYSCDKDDTTTLITAEYWDDGINLKMEELDNWTREE